MKEAEEFVHLLYPSNQPRIWRISYWYISAATLYQRSRQQAAHLGHRRRHAFNTRLDGKLARRMQVGAVCGHQTLKFAEAKMGIGQDERPRLVR